MPNQPKTPHMSVRMPRELQDAVKARAEEKGETVTDAINRWARRYVQRRSP